MQYYIDTNICISCIRESTGTEDIGYHFILHEDDIRIPSVVAAELMHGAFKSKRQKEGLRETEEFLADFEVVPFDYPAAIEYGKIKTTLEHKGLVIGPNDLLIAATVLSRKGTLITNNTKEFSRIEGLMLEDWTAAN